MLCHWLYHITSIDLFDGRLFRAGVAAMLSIVLVMCLMPVYIRKLQRLDATSDFDKDGAFGIQLALQCVAEHTEPVVMQVLPEGERTAHGAKVDVFHGKTGGGYLTQFYPPIGDITYLAITQDRNGVFKFIVAEGVNIDGPIFTFGDTNMRTRFSIGAREFCNRWSEAGPTHHMAAAVGRHIGTLLKVAKIFNVAVDVICR